MKWTSVIAERGDVTSALEACARQAVQDLGPHAAPDLVVVFLSAPASKAHTWVPSLLRAYFPRAVVIGCTAAGVIGSSREVEGRTAVALLAGHLPDAAATPFRVTWETLPSPDDPPDAWAATVGVDPGSRTSFLLFGAPSCSFVEQLLAGLDYAYPQSVKAGGLAAGTASPGSNLLYQGGEVYSGGMVGVALTGDITVDAIVAQSCRPIGAPKRVSACVDTLVTELDGESPVEYLREVYRSLPTRDQHLLRKSLFLGVAMDSLLMIDRASPGEFLIQEATADYEQDSLSLAGQIREGQLVQYHLCDPVTATRDLERRLQRYLQQTRTGSIGAVLRFQGIGRGLSLYGWPDHETKITTTQLGPLPMGGCFCDGEIGPVTGTTYLHRHTSSLAILRRP